MSEYQPQRFSSMPLKHTRIKTKKGRLKIDVPTESFKTAFSTFSKAAEDFAMTLSDVWHRKFAYKYFTYLQEIACNSAPVKPNRSGDAPARRLICYELERLFRSHFFKPDEIIAH